MSCIGVTLIVVLRYVGQYDPDTTDFGVNPWYNDEWTARALNEFQMVLVVSWSDLFSRAVFSVGLVVTTTNMKELLAGRQSNKVASISDAMWAAPKSVKVKSNLKAEFPSVGLLPEASGNVNHEKEPQRSTFETTMHGIHILFLVWGFTVLGFHIHASVQPALEQCTLQVRPWAVSTPYCFLVSLNCDLLKISGQLDEVQDKWSEFDASTSVMMVIKHCPSLVVPDLFNEFHQLISIKVYNSTIVEWKDSTAITNTNHSKLLSLMLVRVNMTDGKLPAGFQSIDPPLNLYDFEFCITNLRELPDDLDSKWFVGSYVIIEYSQLTSVPASLIRIMPPYFSLNGNPIREIPPEVFEIEGLTDLGIGDTEISDFPQNVTQVSSTLTSIYASSTNISCFWAWTDQLLGRTSIRGVPRSIYAGNTPYCDELQRIMNGSADVFSTSLSQEYSLLMDAAKVELIESFVDCNPTVSGVSGPLYPLIAEDINNAISLPA